jgi:hypothetical protein
MVGLGFCLQLQAVALHCCGNYRAFAARTGNILRGDGRNRGCNFRPTSRVTQQSPGTFTWPS